MNHKNFFSPFFVLSVLLLLMLPFTPGCSTYKQHLDMPRAAAPMPMTPPAKRQQEPYVRENLREMKTQEPKPEELKTPEYQPVSDEMTPAKTRLVNIQARNTALGDILQVIAEAASLNLVVADGVQQDRSITINLKRVTADDALTTILNSVDYFYSIKDNILTVEATGTKIFELGHPALVQGYSTDVGGDILGSAISANAGGSGGSGGSGSSGSSSSSGSGSSSSNIKGTITQTVKNDAAAFNFWDSLEKSLQLLIGKQFDNSGRNNNSPQPAATAQGNTGNIERTLIPAPQQSGEPVQSVTINRLTGTVMVTATRKNLAKVEEFLNTVRSALNRQVLVEARVIEVQLADNLKFGIDWDFLNNVRWFNTTGTALGGFGTAASTLQAAQNSGAFRLGYSGGNAQALLTALRTQGEVKTLSNPRINVMNGQTALLTVGRNFNYISKVTSSTTTAAGSTPTVTFSVETGNVLSGMIIGLAPHINSKGEISMTVTPIISDLVSLEEKKVGTDPTNQTMISIPTVDLRELSTTIKVRNGEMIIIGGLISNKQNYQDEKIPLLGDIPWLGTLFTRKDHKDSRTELVVILQPHLLTND